NFSLVLGIVLIIKASRFLFPKAKSSCFLEITKSFPFFSGATVISSAKKKNCFKLSLMECTFSVICPTHSVCVPCACGLNQILLKFISAPSATLATHSPSLTASILGASKYQAFTLLSEALKGIEISKGFDKSICRFFELYSMVASIYSVLGFTKWFYTNILNNKQLCSNSIY